MVLFVETSWEKGSLALADLAGAINELSWQKQSSHSEVITMKFEELIQGSSSKISKVVVNVGPGSFTGVRVGLGFATTLAYLNDLPIYALNSLEVMARKANKRGQILVTIPAIKGHFYSAGFEVSQNGMKPIFEPQSKSESEIEELRTKFDVFIDGSSSENRLTASDLVQFFQNPPYSLKELSWKFVKPLYLRRSEAEEKLRIGLLKPMYAESEQEIERKKPK